MKLSNQNYDALKWIVQVVMPALIVAIGTIGGAVAWEHTELTMTVLGAITTFMGASLGLSSAEYYKDEADK
ncbi:holin [Aerococcaceae bacterium DSM 111022]|nr:holin [Aerococcaceae bacterium DSM 111022]